MQHASYVHLGLPCLHLVLLQTVLHTHPQPGLFPVVQVAGQGRGLVATRDLEYGEVLFSERPYLCVPALSKRKQVCYHCLKVLQTGHADGNQTLHTRSGAFCSQGCLSAAQGSYFILESQVNLSQLEQYCEASNERFPLLAAR